MASSMPRSATAVRTLLPALSARPRHARVAATPLRELGVPTGRRVRVNGLSDGRGLPARSARPPPPIPRRAWSSVPFLPGSFSSHDEVYERSFQNAAAFDANHDLVKNDTMFSTWRSRQMAITEGGPVVAHPRSPPKIIAPSPDRPPSFFPPYAHTGRPPVPTSGAALIHNEESADRMRRAGRLARQLLDYACHPSVARAGRTTEEIDDVLHDACLERGAYPSPLNYAGFPKSVCSSVNEVVCHGIPDSRQLKSGDVVSIDVSCYLDGVHGDNCATIVVGDVEEGCDPGEYSWDSAHSNERDNAGNEDGVERRDWPSYPLPAKTTFLSADEEERFVTARRLAQAALESRDEGVAACRPGGCLSDIGGAIHAVADAYGYDTGRAYHGHGISSDFHHAPFVKHFRNNDEMELLPGMIFTIEPMLTEGNAIASKWSDMWTVATLDGGRAAQFEHTVLITETGVEILTLP